MASKRTMAAAMTARAPSATWMRILRCSRTVVATPSAASASARLNGRSAIGGQLLDEPARQAVHARGLAALVMIVAAQMQRAVHDQPQQLLAQGGVVIARLAARGVDGDDHVAERFTRAFASAELE